MQTLLRCFIVATLLVGSMGARVALAWNPTGHMTVDLIAWRRLSDGQRKQLGEILKSHPHYDSYLIQDKPDDVDEAQWAFLKAGCWADYVRPGRDAGEAKPESVTKFHHGPWHYVDYPFIAPHDSAKIDSIKFDSAKLQPPAENLLSVLPDRVAGLRHAPTSDAEREQRAVDLCWVLHLVGDMHQPLHCISLYSDSFRQGDMGGNAQAIRVRSKPMNLHWYWDELLGTGTDYALLDQLARSITDNPALGPEKLPELRSHTTLAAWVSEGFADAKGITYLGGQLKTANWKAYESQQIKAEDVPELPTMYEANARECACRRVALAGYRLAELLSQSLQ